MDFGELGRILSRDEALQHPWKQEVFNLSDRILECDKPLTAYLTAPEQFYSRPERQTKSPSREVRALSQG